MHEMSLVEALLEVVQRHVPAATSARRVSVEVGPLQAVEASAMQWAWQVSRVGTPVASAELELLYLPWRWRCPQCAREWESSELLAGCVCGASGRPVGGDELRLVALEVEPLEPSEPSEPLEPSEPSEPREHADAPEEQERAR
ncbi:MAG: hydrogenase maturation nickel metallochaperone HypA [Pirellulales bacterium]